MALVNPAFQKEPEKLDGKCKEEEEGVRKVEELLDFVIKTDMEGFDQEFQVRKGVIRALVDDVSILYSSSIKWHVMVHNPKLRLKFLFSRKQVMLIVMYMHVFFSHFANVERPFEDYTLIIIYHPLISWEVGV